MSNYSFDILAALLETKVFKIFSTYRPNQSFEITSQWRLYKQYAQKSWYVYVQYMLTLARHLLIPEIDFKISQHFQVQAKKKVDPILVTNATKNLPKNQNWKITKRLTNVLVIINSKLQLQLQQQQQLKSSKPWRVQFVIRCLQIKFI